MLIRCKEVNDCHTYSHFPTSHTCHTYQAWLVGSSPSIYLTIHLAPPSPHLTSLDSSHSFYVKYNVLPTQCQFYGVRCQDYATEPIRYVTNNPSHYIVITADITLYEIFSFTSCPTTCLFVSSRIAHCCTQMKYILCQW